MIQAGEITGLVLAGGRGQRMGGADKGLLPWAGGTLAGWALERLRQQVGPRAVSANRHLSRYQALGVPVWQDAQAFEGPLGGMLAGLAHCQTPWLLCVPCDAPFFPLDLAKGLAKACGTEPGQARMAAARTQRAAPRSEEARGDARPGDGALEPDEPRAGPQPVFCLMHRSLLEPLAQFLAQGSRRAGEWARVAGAAWVDFDAEGFRNLNTPEAFASLTQESGPPPLGADAARSRGASLP